MNFAWVDPLAKEKWRNIENRGKFSVLLFTIEHPQEEGGQCPIC
jgi:hypothetical protein